jgi:hypothetical protein
VRGSRFDIRRLGEGVWGFLGLGGVSKQRGTSVVHELTSEFGWEAGTPPPREKHADFLLRLAERDYEGLRKIRAPIFAHQELTASSAVRMLSGAGR